MDLPDTLAADLYDFAFCPEPCYERLVDLANPEPWGEGNRVLKNYLLFSFKRAVQLTKRDHATAATPSALPIVFDEGLCLFNTGLYTRRYETVYALFEPNTREDARQRWFLKGFFKESDPALLSFECLPCRVRFAEDPSELVFDYRLPIRSNITTSWGTSAISRASPRASREKRTLCCCDVPSRAPWWRRRAVRRPTTRLPFRSSTTGGFSCSCRCVSRETSPSSRSPSSARTASTRRAPASRWTWPTTTRA